MRAFPGGQVSVLLSGNGSSVVVQKFFGNETENKVNLNCLLRRVVLRGTGGITAADIAVVHRNQAIANAMTYSSIPGENIVADWSALPVTASATAVFLDDQITEEPRAQSSLGLVANVTASGDWTIVGYLDLGV